MDRKPFSVFMEAVSCISKRLVILIMSILLFSIMAGNIHAQISDVIFNNTMVRMTWQEVQAAAEKKSIVLVPISVVEEHGPHMDLSPDITETSWACSKMKDWLDAENIPTVIAPPFYWGINIASGRFEGSFNLSTSTMMLVMTEIIANMKAWGFDKFYLVNIHGDSQHKSTVTSIAKKLNAIDGQEVYDVTLLPRSPDAPSIPSRPAGAYSPDYHAGALETKTVWSIEPSIVRSEIAATLSPQSSFSQPLGYVGDPSNYMTDNGDKIFQAYVSIWAHNIKYQLLSSGTNGKLDTNRPDGFLLDQNYPNPFNPTTTINYEVPELCRVSLIVFDTLGQEIIKLVDEVKSRGKYQVSFNAEGLPSGNYFYKLQSGNYYESRKMTLVK